MSDLIREGNDFRIPTAVDDKVYGKNGKPSIYEQLKIAFACRRLEDLPTIKAAIAAAGINVARMTNDDVLEVAHRIRLGLVTCTPKEKADSEEWLRRRKMM